MTIAKLSSSKKALVVIDDQGNVFVAPAYKVAEILEGTRQMTLFSRMPARASAAHFKVSPVYGDAVAQPGELTRANDSLSKQALEGKAATRPIEDAEVDW